MDGLRSTWSRALIGCVEEFHLIFFSLPPLVSLLSPGIVLDLGTRSLVGGVVL